MFKLTSMSTDALFIAVCLQGSFYGKSFLDLSWPLLNLEVPGPGLHSGVYLQ